MRFPGFSTKSSIEGRELGADDGNLDGRTDGYTEILGDAVYSEGELDWVTAGIADGIDDGWSEIVGAREGIIDGLTEGTEEGRGVTGVDNVGRTKTFRSSGSL